jgi:hypothetical protein
MMVRLDTERSIAVSRFDSVAHIGCAFVASKHISEHFNFIERGNAHGVANE